jgi:hypothetical protein
MKTRTGEDALFINQAANSTNTTLCDAKNSFVSSDEMPKYSQWVENLRINYNHFSKFKFFDNFNHTLFFYSQLLFILLPIVLLIFQFQWIIVVSIIVLRYIITWCTLGFSAGKLNEKDVMYWYPIIEIIMIFIQFNINIKNKLSKPTDWK